ncbi:Tolloid-like protein 2, partial [Clonorchis sinensis]
TCGGTFKEPSGQIISPGYPAEYPTDITCDWYILEPRMPSVLKFVDFQIEDQGCIFDVVFVVIGTGSKEVIHGPYCGNKKPPDFAFNQTVRVNFQSDRESVDRGFLAEFGYCECLASSILWLTPNQIHSCTYNKVYGKLTGQIIFLSDLAISAFADWSTNYAYSSRFGHFCAFAAPNRVQEYSTPVGKQCKRKNTGKRSCVYTRPTECGKTPEGLVNRVTSYAEERLIDMFLSLRLRHTWVYWSTHCVIRKKLTDFANAPRFTQELTVIPFKKMKGETVCAPPLVKYFLLSKSAQIDFINQGPLILHAFSGICRMHISVAHSRMGSHIRIPHFMSSAFHYTHKVNVQFSDYRQLTFWPMKFVPLGHSTRKGLQRKIG